MSDLTIQEAFLEGMSRAATFVTVATTDGPAGRFGVTVSSMTSVSADGDYPSLLICVHHQSPSATAILRNEAFCANLLAEGQMELSRLFASSTGAVGHAERFAACDWTASGGGQPVLAGVTAAFDCVLASSLMWESHYVIIGKVKDVRLSADASVLLYGKRAYKRAVDLG